MNQATRFILRVLAALMLLTLALPSAFAQETSSVRFTHAIPNVAPVDVYINGTLALTDISFGEASNYLTVPAGNHTVTLTPVGIPTPIFEQSITAEANRAATFVASSASAGRFDSFSDNLATTNLGSTRLLLVHAIEGAPNVDVQLAETVQLGDVEQAAGTTIAQGLAYGNSFGAFDLPAQAYSFDILPSGSSDPLLDNVSLPLNSGTSYIAIVYGTADAPQALLLGAPTAPATDSGFVRFAHGVVNAPAVDVYVNDTLIVPALSPDTPSAHLALPAGTHTASYRLNTGEEIGSVDFTVDAGAAQTLIALGADGGLVIESFADDISGVTGTTGAAQVINAIQGAVADVTLSDGTIVAGAVAAGSSSAVSTFAPAKTNLTVALTAGDETGELSVDNLVVYGGVYYNLIVLDGSGFNPPRVIVAETALAQGVQSAPNAGNTTIATGTTGEVSEVVTAPQPEQAAPPAQVVQPTPAVPVAVGGEDVVTARVVLDPSANLQLRQYPSPDALSLGLAPSGTTLEVIAREGRPVALVEGQDPPPEAAEYVDPADFLVDETDDLNPEETWLRVIYTTPDGGDIEAWVLAQFLVVRDEDGDLQRLADLPTVGLNVPGEARGTELTPPPIPEDVVTAEVFNLNPGVSLNIRRTPTTGGEVLERLPLGTVVELLALLNPATDDDTDTTLPEDAEWAYIQYRPAGGGSITGWVSTLYIQYSWNNRRIDAEELFERELIDYEDGETIGRITGGAEQAALPTPDPLEDAYVAEVRINPGANLQFRIAPDAQSESLNLIPSGTRLILDGRTADGEWARTTYEGQQGFIATGFVVISFNGDFVEVPDVPILVETTEETEDDTGN